MGNVIIKRLIQHCSCLLIRFIIVPFIRPLSASQSVNQNHFFSKTTDWIMEFHTTFWFLKDKKVIDPGKNLIFGKKPEISLKVRLLELAKDLFHCCAIFWFTWCNTVVFLILQKLHVLRKSLSQLIYKNALNESESFCPLFFIKFLFFHQI